MNAVLRWVLTVVCLSLLLTWCFLNRQNVAFDVSPGHDPVQIPLFGVLFLAAVLGFLWGTGITWLNGATDRMERRRLARANRGLEDKINTLQGAALADKADVMIDQLLPVKRRWWPFG